MVNLLSNAVKFTHRGEINVRASSRLCPDRPDDCIVEITVEDTGIGIGPEVRALTVHVCVCVHACVRVHARVFVHARL